MATTYKEWPADINTVILAEGYSKTAQSNVISSDNEAGPQQRRRRYTAVPYRHTIQLRLENSIPVRGGMTEFQLFEAFVHDTLYSGIANTRFPLPWTYEPKTCFFYFTNGGQPYSVSRYWGPYVYVTFTLEEVLA